jgi:hypothetical protein
MEIIQKSDDGIIQVSTPDSLLGDSSQRYFGSNFKKITHLIDEMKVEKGDLVARCSIQWPESWSKKKDVSLHPHIGTLDFFLIASMLTEAFFKVIGKMDDSQIRGMWISEFHCKVGNKCIESNTHNCKCQLISEILNSTAKQTEFILETSIAGAKVVLKVLAPDRNEKYSFDSKQESYYSSCYKEASRDITNIRICPAKKSIVADYKLMHANNFSCNGIGSVHIPCITFCDLVLVCWAVISNTSISNRQYQ